jgi:hypothetical protein
VQEQEMFKTLQQRLNNGENLLIIEIDGPYQESLEYYKEKYGVNNNFIENDTMLVTSTNIGVMLKDSNCLAMALLEYSIMS